MKRFQNKVAEGRFSLPIASIYGVLALLAAGLINQNFWFPILLMALCVYLMAEMNNRNALLRIRSRMVSCCFIMLMSMSSMLLLDTNVSLALLCFVAYQFLIFYTCQNPGAVGIVFYAFFFIGMASLISVHLLLLVPVLLLLLSRPLYGLSGRTMSAAVMATMVPYWMTIIYLIYIGDYEPLMAHFSPLADTSILFNYEKVTIGMVINFAVVVVSMLTGIVHFMQNAYKDKIRVRLLFRMMIVLSLILMILIAVAPAMYNYLLPMMVVTVSPLIAHFFTFTDSRITNYTFITWLVITILITLYSLCLTSSYNMVLSECL